MKLESAYGKIGKRVRPLEDCTAPKSRVAIDATSIVYKRRLSFKADRKENSISASLTSRDETNDINFPQEQRFSLM